MEPCVGILGGAKGPSEGVEETSGEGGEWRPLGCQWQIGSADSEIKGTEVQ